MRLNEFINSKINFQGYDARPLKAIAITEPGYGHEIARELEEISKIGNFKTKLQNIPTIKAVNKTPNVESTTAWGKIFFASFHFVQNPPKKIINPKAKDANSLVNS